MKTALSGIDLQMCCCGKTAKFPPLGVYQLAWFLLLHRMHPARTWIILFYMPLMLSSQGTKDAGAVSCPAPSARHHLAITANVVAAHRLLDDLSPVAFNVAMHVRPWRRVGLKLAWHDLKLQQSGYFSVRGGGTKADRSTVRLRGARSALKFYVRARDDGRQHGFYFGPFLDVLRGSRRIVIRRSDADFAKTEDMTVVTDTLAGRGFFIGGGMGAGYSFTFGRFVIEPSIGLGFGGMTGTLAWPARPDAFVDLSGLSNALIGISATHAQLHIGWVLY